MLLQCSEPCGVAGSPLREDRVCGSCGAPVELVPERPSARAEDLRALWTSRRASIEPADRSGVWLKEPGIVEAERELGETRAAHVEYRC